MKTLRTHWTDYLVQLVSPRAGTRRVELLGAEGRVSPQKGTRRIEPIAALGRISPAARVSRVQPLRAHWPEYLIEATALGLFMISACSFGVLLEHPTSAVHQALPDPLIRRVLMGIAMGLTAVGIISSPWGQRSGAHMNPAVTLTFLALGKIAPWDALFYIAAQFAGGIGGVTISHWILGPALGHTAVHYVATVPGPGGPWIAFWAEFAISLILMITVLMVSNSRRLARFTPWFAGFLVAAYITMEAPLSGMSMNPARTLGSAVPAREWQALWIYFLAPPAAMLLAGRLYRWPVFCAKLHHHNSKRCIFRCNYGALVS